MTDTTTIPVDRTNTGFVDVALFLAMGIALVVGTGYIGNEQSVVAGVLGVFGTLGIAWALLAVRGQGWRDAQTG